jgi:hypothetical protein
LQDRVGALKHNQRRQDPARSRFNAASAESAKCTA